MFSCQLICLHGRSRTHRVASLCAGPVGRISYNLYFDCKLVRYVTLINEYTTNQPNLPIFRSRLKTHLFKIAFPPIGFFLLTLCLQDYLIHRFCSAYMSEHLWVRGPWLSLLQSSGTLSHQTCTRSSLSVSTFRSKLKTHLFKLALNSLPSLSIGLLIRI